MGTALRHRHFIARGRSRVGARSGSGITYMAARATLPAARHTTFQARGERRCRRHIIFSPATSAFTRADAIFRLSNTHYQDSGFTPQSGRYRHLAISGQTWMASTRYIISAAAAIGRAILSTPRQISQEERARCASGGCRLHAATAHAAPISASISARRRLVSRQFRLRRAARRRFTMVMISTYRI